MYKGLDPRLIGAAGRSVLAHLMDLEKTRRGARGGGELEFEAMTSPTGTNRFTFGFALVAMLAALWFGYQHFVAGRPDAKTVVAVSLRGLQEQQRLVPFTARYVAVVTSSERKLGLSAQKDAHPARHGAL